MRFKAFAALALAAAVMFVGCAKAPSAEVEAAKAAVEAAKTAEAEMYVADQFKAASDSLNAGLAEIEKQNAAFALTRNYEAAKKTLAGAAAAAQAASAAAVAAKETVKAEVTTMLDSTKASVVAAKDLLAKAPKGKEGKEALEAIATDLATVDGSVTAAESDIASGAYMAAKDKLVAATDKVASLTAELTAAIEKSKAGKGKKK